MIGKHVNFLKIFGTVMKWLFFSCTGIKHFSKTREQYMLVIGVFIDYIRIKFHLGLMNKQIHVFALLSV